MGYTSFSKQLVDGYISEYNPKSVIDLGAQNDFSGPDLPAPYISEWYKGKSINYACIDLNGENGALVLDLGIDLRHEYGHRHDIVCDFGTSEHVGRKGKFDWDAIYMCWWNKFNICKQGGLIISENPLVGNWPEHGFNYYEFDFYSKITAVSGLILREVGKHAAMGNIEDGWNVFSVMEKTASDFCSFEEFMSLPIKQS